MQELNSSHIEHRHALNSVKNEVNKWHEHTMLYLRLAETLCAVKEANFYRCGKAFPQSAPLAKAVMASQSYIANCGGVGSGQKRKSWELHDENNSHSDSEASEEDTMESTMMSQNSSTIALSRKLRSIKLASRELARGKERLLHRHLATFTSIRITTAIALIADNLTPRAAELVSRACCPDSPDNRTPFDLVKNMIALIEDEGTLISAPKVGWDMRGKIIDETLVSVMQEAAAVFQTCTEKDPENVDHWSWFVATLLGMLCIAFGSTRDSIIHSNIKMGCEPSERPQLQRYPDIRVNAADAMRQFINYAHSHDAPMFHLAIASMLEWNKAASLLHRPQELGFGLEVKRLHAYHVSCLLSN
jgi:DNA-binding TFAR19-related protein (PDSD5 family)